jgi:hypothetical protein
MILMPANSQLVDEEGLMSIAWRSYFDSQAKPVAPSRAQVTEAAGKIGLSSSVDLQIIPLKPAGAVTTDNIAFSGNPKNGARIILVCLQNSVTIKDNDADGGCALGADLTINEKRTASFIYMEEIKRFLRI